MSDTKHIQGRVMHLKSDHTSHLGLDHIAEIKLVKALAPVPPVKHSETLPSVRRVYFISLSEQ
jgi:hypothetical protein